MERRQLRRRRLSRFPLKRPAISTQGRARASAYPPVRQFALFLCVRVLGAASGIGFLRNRFSPDYPDGKLAACSRFPLPLPASSLCFCCCCCCCCVSACWPPPLLLLLLLLQMIVADKKRASERGCGRKTEVRSEEQEDELLLLLLADERTICPVNLLHCSVIGRRQDVRMQSIAAVEFPHHVDSPPLLSTARTSSVFPHRCYVCLSVVKTAV